MLMPLMRPNACAVSDSSDPSINRPKSAGAAIKMRPVTAASIVAARTLHLDISSFSSPTMVPEARYSLALLLRWPSRRSNSSSEAVRTRGCTLIVTLLSLPVKRNGT